MKIGCRPARHSLFDHTSKERQGLGLIGAVLSGKPASLQLQIGG